MYYSRRSLRGPGCIDRAVHTYTGAHRRGVRQRHCLRTSFRATNIGRRSCTAFTSSAAWRRPDARPRGPSHAPRVDRLAAEDPEHPLRAFGEEVER